MTLEEFYAALEDIVSKKSLRGNFYLDASRLLRNRYGNECPICALANVRLTKDKYRNADFVNAGINELFLTVADANLIADAADSRTWRYETSNPYYKRIVECRDRLYQICGVEQ